MEDEDAAETTQSLADNIDVCQQLLNRYAQSSATQHRHLCATAAATRSILQASSLPLTPVSYFAATITSISNFSTLDATAVSALTSFLSIVLPLVHKEEIKSEKAEEAVRVLIRMVEDSGGNLGTSSVKAVVKCVGVLVAGFYDLKEWEPVAVGFEWLVKLSLDKRPKVRKCAQECLLTVFKSFESSTAFKKASKLMYLFLKDHMQLAVEMTALKIGDGSKNKTVWMPEHQEVLHVLNVMKHVVPYISIKFRTRVLSQLLKVLSPQFSAVTRHAFDVISVIFGISESEVIVSNAEDIFKSLAPCISLGERNPADTVLLAANLAKIALGKLHDGDLSEWTVHFHMVMESVAVLLSSEGNIALQTLSILRELIDHHIDGKHFLKVESQEMEDKAPDNAEAKAIVATCSIFYNLLSSSQVPSELVFSAVAFLFLKLGEVSAIFMKPILLKLADLMNASSASGQKIKNLQECIGSAVVAMGPDKLLALLPISLAEDFSCSNIWLLPILKRNIVGSSLRFFMEHIVPLAESFEQASRKVKKSVIGRDLQAYAHGCWELLPAFCRQPSDTYKSFGALAKLLVPFVERDSFMLENIAIGLEELVNRNRRALNSDQGSAELMDIQRTGTENEFAMDLKTQCYSRKIATKNIRALSMYSKELLQVLTTVLLESPPEIRRYLKGAIECLASIGDPSVTRQIFIASMRKFQLLDDISEHEDVQSETNGSADEKSMSSSVGKDTKRCLILELASCVVEGSDDDLVNLIFSITKRALQATDEVGQMEAYQTLNRILEKHSWFCSSQFDVVMDLLAELKSSANIPLLQNRFACFQALLIHALMRNIEEEDTKAFLILNEIVLTLKDSSEEGRKAAYDSLNWISSKLRDSPDPSGDGLYHKLLTMVIGYLSASLPHIKSGVVSALSVFVYNDPGICIKMPVLVASVLELLHSKAVEVIKAVLGFVKVLVSCLESNDLQSFLSDIVDGIIRWSSVSRHHFKTKVVVILEIAMRKCGATAVNAFVPEKYRDFVQGVVANRHGKTNSKAAESKEAGPELSDSSRNGQQKRKREEPPDLSKQESSGKPWKRRDKRQSGWKSLERSGHSDHKRDLKGNGHKHQRDSKRDFKRGFSGGKKHKDNTTIKRNREANVRRSAVPSKFSKHKKGGKKGHKMS